MYYLNLIQQINGINGIQYSYKTVFIPMYSFRLYRQYVLFLDILFYRRYLM